MTTPQNITEDLRRWIISQAEAGCVPGDMVKAMVASGWHEDVAIDAMEVTLREHLKRQGVAVPEPAAAPAVPLPEPRVADGGNMLEVDGRQVKVVMSMTHPRVVVFADLLSREECEALIALSEPRLARSQTVDTATGGSEVNAARTSDGMFFQRGETPLIDRIERRLAMLLHWPLDHGEGLQILRYRPGAGYKPHHD